MPELRRSGYDLQIWRKRRYAAAAMSTLRCYSARRRRAFPACLEPMQSLLRLQCQTHQLLPRLPYRRQNYSTTSLG